MPLKLPVLLCIILLGSCASMQNTLYLVFIDDIDGETFLLNKPNVKFFLEDLLGSQEDFAVEALSRTLVSFQEKRTELMTHNYYLISFSGGRYHTLSYFGTRFSFHSEGTWVLDAKSDVASYRMYKDGKNKWDLIKLFPEKTIDARQTLRNILDVMGTNITYYYLDHIKDKPNVMNCNTALFSTVALTE